MKKIKAFLLLLVSLFCVGSLAACDGLPSFINPSHSESSESVEEESESTPPASSEEEEVFGEGYTTITIAEALELCGEPGNVTQRSYFIIATIDSVTNAMFGAMNISDETGTIGVYNTKSATGVNYEDMTERPVKGDTVLMACFLQNHNGTKEVKQAYIIDFKKAVIDESDYSEMTIADARTAEKDALIKVSGVVAQITYANGFVPNGVMLVDETGSIYVYDKDVASEVKEGNTVTILGKKDFWILDTEMSAAQKHGYKGCNQLTDAMLIANDGEVNAFATSGIQETTIKDIMENPLSNDITTAVYKVNALVKKVDGQGFVNYYFFDIDGETGNYTYTQCNGSDFAWLDQFDGKICTVYLTALNAKSEATGCSYRFLPVEVVDENYQFDMANAAKFVVEYHGVEQFLARYTADPAKVVPTSISSELLGFEGATLSYASNNTSVVYFEEVEGEVIFHCGEVGVATVTVTGEYNGVTFEQSVQISVEEAITYDALTVAEAIQVPVDTENVIVKGIVGPSVVNKNGFYLFGEDGSMISVLVNATSEFVGLEIGNEVVLQGTRERYVKDDTKTIAGQTCIVNAVILVNNYGSHEYSTEKFVNSTVADFYALDNTVDYSTTVFVLTATINYEQTNYYTKLNLKSGSDTITLYMSGAGQYSWMKDYYGQEVTLEIAACNWNDKSFWAGCALAIRLSDGTKILNTLNFDSY